MKTPEQIYDDFHIAELVYPYDLTAKQVIMDAIKMAGIDGWNSALDWATKNASAYNTVPRVYSDAAVDIESILKGKI